MSRPRAGPGRDVSSLRRQFDVQGAAIADWLEVLPEAAWPAPSALPGWTVTELSMHTAQVAQALTDALAAGPVGTVGARGSVALDIAAYTAAWVNHAEEIADRSREAARGLDPAAVLRQHAADRAALAAALDATPGDPVIAARRGPIRLSAMLVTRVSELVVHATDLSRSVPSVPPVPLAAEAVATSCRMLAEILVARAPGRSVELRVPPHVAVQCVAGPQHTRGTPGAVVQTDPLTWIALATGRAAWSGALATGRLSASGLRADLSGYLPVLA
ncbi:MAG TPA: sterol carrier family protein [Mycobacteriales bacterium]|nr:sterol carrier family protein [Mycobacteriales bacterium]